MLNPKCGIDKSCAMNAQGFLIPCCWLDPIRKLSTNYSGNMEDINYLFKEELNIKNVDSVEDILLSDEWLQFFHNLIEEKDVPTLCKKYCSSEKSNKLIDVYNLD